jgi:GNAT superfamily N-acetyltransferase
MRLVVAEGDTLAEIIDATYPIWSEGLTRDTYARWNAAQMRTAWGKDHLHRFALLDDDGRWVASAKRYRLPMSLNGVKGVMAGLGAVFTRPDVRGRGYASAIIEQLVADAGAEGAAVAGLFSEIGDEFYQRLGFTPCRWTKWTWRSSGSTVRRQCWCVRAKRATCRRWPRCTRRDHQV